MDLFQWLWDFCEFLQAWLVSRLFALPWSPWRLRRLVVLKHSWPIVMHIQRFHWILVTFRFGLTVHQSNGASKRAFCRMHRKMELCNYHSGQHCSWDCLQMDCAHGPSTQTFRPISLAFRWNLRPLDSLIREIHSFRKSVGIPVDGLFKNQNLEQKIEKLLRIWAIWAQDRLLYRSTFSFSGLHVRASTGIFPVKEKSMHVIEHSWISCRRRRLWICKNVSRYTMRVPNTWLQIFVAA